MNLNSEFETMAEIEKLLESSSFKSKLQRNEVIDPEEFLNDSLIDDIQTTNMKSLYLTEPISIHLKNNNKLHSNHAENVDNDQTMSNEAEIVRVSILYLDKLSNK